MSVQSQIDRIANEVGTQADLIAQISTVLNGKAGSGGGITPTGTKQITTNGTHDVTTYANAYVNVPVGVFPTGTKEITENGEYDVTSYAKMKVNVPTSGAPEAVEQAMPSITVSSAGLITAKATQAAGYVEAGTKEATKQLTTQSAKTVTPGKSDQTAVASGRYTTGAIIVKGDSALEPGNIRSGVSIFGVAGSYTGSGGGGGSGGTSTSVVSFTVTGNSYGCEVAYINSNGALTKATADGTYQTMCGFVAVSYGSRHLSGYDRIQEMEYGASFDVQLLIVPDGAEIVFV